MKKTIIAATIGFLVLFVFFIGAAIVALTSIEENNIWYKISETISNATNRDARVPVRNADESDLPYGTVCHVADGLPVAGSPGGGITMGWGLPDEYTQSATRYKLLPFAQHDAYAIDLSTFNQPQDVIPVYSTLEGTVVEITTGSKPGYGGFERVRNARWSCVNGEDLWQIKPDEEICSQWVPEHMWDDLKVPSTGCTSYEQSGCSGPVEPRLTTAGGNKWWRCQTCEQGNCGCMYEFHERDCEIPDAMDPSKCTKWQSWKKIKTECQLSEIAEDITGDAITGQERVRMVMRAPECAGPYAGSACTGDEGPGRCCMQGLTAANFGDMQLSELRYGKVGNYEIVQADQTTDTLQVGTGESVDKNTQTGTMGTSGQGVNAPMVHYEVWKYSYCGVLGDPNGAWSPVDPEQYLDTSSGDNPGGIPLPCCPEPPFGLFPIGESDSIACNEGSPENCVSIHVSITDNGDGTVTISVAYCAHNYYEGHAWGDVLVNGGKEDNLSPLNGAIPQDGCMTKAVTRAHNNAKVTVQLAIQTWFTPAQWASAVFDPTNPDNAETDPAILEFLAQRAKLCSPYDYPYLDQTTDRRDYP